MRFVYYKRFKFLRVAALATIVGCLTSVVAANAKDGPIRIVALGDSLSAGYQLPASAAFPNVLQREIAKTRKNVTVDNAGVSGDTANDGLARLDWSVGDGVDAVILELGANDMLRGVAPSITREALDKILSALKARGVKVLLAGMLASPSMGQAYAAEFNAIYPELATKYGVVFYPFFLDGVVADRSLLLSDGMHPNRAGVERIVAGIMPQVVELLAAIDARH